jgi:hypothetical protein
MKLKLDSFKFYHCSEPQPTMLLTKIFFWLVPYSVVIQFPPLVDRKIQNSFFYTVRCATQITQFEIVLVVDTVMALQV